MSSDSEFTIPIGFTLEDAQKQLKQIEQWARSTGKGIQDGFKPATESVGGLEGALKKFSSEQRSQGRVLTFYTRELMEMTGAGNKAKEMFSTLGGVAFEAFSAGAGIGLAMEVVKAFKLVGDQIREAMTASQRALDSISTSFGKFQDQVRDARLTNAQKWFESQFLPGSESGDQYQALQKKVDEWSAKIDQMRRDSPDFAEAGVSEIQEKRIAPLLAEQRQLIDKASALYQDMVNPRSGSGIGFGQTWGVSIPNASPVLQGTGRDAAAERGMMDGYVYAEEFYKATREFSLGAYQATHGIDLAGSQGGVLEARNREGMKNRNVTAMVGQYGVDIRGQYGADVAKPTKTAEEMEQEERKKKAQLEEAQRVKDLEAQYKRFGATVQNALEGVITKQMTAKQAAEAVGKALLKMVIQNALKQITANAFTAGSEAFKALAGIPVIGPILAGGAMTGAISTVLGLKGQIGSAAQGAVLPTSGGPFPFLLHPQEWVLPAQKAQGLDKLIEGGGGGGMSISFNVSALDGADVTRVLENSEAQFRDVFQRWARLGRGPYRGN